MISRTTEYALRSMVFLAMNNAPATAQQIAEGTRIPAGYLPRVLQTLVKAQLIDSQRGAGGGFSLKKPSDQITLLDVVNAVDPFQQYDGCPIKPETSDLCGLHRYVQEATRAAETVLSNTALSQIVRRRKPVPLCEVSATKPGIS